MREPQPFPPISKLRGQAWEEWEGSSGSQGLALPSTPCPGYPPPHCSAVNPIPREAERRPWTLSIFGNVRSLSPSVPTLRQLPRKGPDGRIPAWHRPGAPTPPKALHLPLHHSAN